MPFGCRNIVPTRLGAHEVPQDNVVDKKCVLYSVANNAIVGALLQLSSLVRHADDLFCDISDECQKIVERTETLNKRIRNLDGVINKLDAKQAAIPEGDLKQFTAITSHHQARHGYDTSLFIPTNRPQCVQDLYNLSAPNPTRVIRSADLYRKDGLSGSKMFKCWPVIMNEQSVSTPDLNMPRRVQRVRSFEKKYKTLKIRERPKTIHGLEDFKLEDCKTKSSEEKKTECLTSPEPPVVVTIDTSGSNFERMQSMRSSGRRYQSKAERDKKKKRRRTVSGVENIMSEIEKFDRRQKINEGGPRQTPRSYSFDDLDAEDNIERDEGIMKYLDELEGKMEERFEEEKAQKIMKYFPCRRSRSLPRCMKISGVARSMSGDRKSQRDFNSTYGSSTLSIASLASNASSRFSRSAKRSSIIGNKIKSLVTGTYKDKAKPRPKSLDIDTFLDNKHNLQKTSIEYDERSKSTYSLERNHNLSVPDNLLSREYKSKNSSSTVGPGSYYSFESSTLPRAQAKKYDFPWESLPKDWTTSVKLREISKRRAKEDRQSSSGNWSQSGTSSNRHSLDSDLRSEGFKFNSQYSLGKDSGRDSLTLEEENDCVTDGTSTAGYAADSQSTVTGDSISIGNPKSDFTQLDTEAWIQSLAVRAAKQEGGEHEKCSTLSRLTRQNILALDLMLADGKTKQQADEVSSVYSVDQEGFYTSFHNDSGLRKSTNTLVDDDNDEDDVKPIDFSPTKDSVSVCSADSVIHRPVAKSDKFAGLRRGNSGGTLKVVSKVTPPAPPQRTTSTKTHQEGELTPTNTPELHSFPSQESSVSESDAEAVFNRVHDKTNITSTGFPSLVALSTSDDESSPETKTEKYQLKGLTQSSSAQGLSDITHTSNISNLSYQSGSVYDSSDNGFSLLKHSVSTLECTQKELDSLIGTPDHQAGSSAKSQAGYQSWPRSHKNTPTSGILKTPEKQFDVTRPQKTLNFAPVVNLFKEGALKSVQMPLPSPTNSSCSESNGTFGMPHLSSFQPPNCEEQSYNLSIPIEQNQNRQKLNQEGNKQQGIPLKYQPVITVTPRSRSGERSGPELNKSQETVSRQHNSKGFKPSAQSTPHIDQNSNRRSSPVLYAVSPVMAPKDPSRQNSTMSNSSSNSGYMDMQNHLKSAGSINSLASSEGINESSTYMSMSSPCSSPNLSNMDFPISFTPSGSMDSLLDLRKTPTNELENDSYRINTSLPYNRQYSSGSQSSSNQSGSQSSLKDNFENSNTTPQNNGHVQSYKNYKTPNSSSKYTPGRRSMDSVQSDLTCVTPMSFNSSMGSNATPVSKNSTPSSRNVSNGQREQQNGRRSRADERKEPSYRNYKASNRRSLPSDMSHTNTHIRHVPLNDTPSARNMSKQSNNHTNSSMSSSKSCPVGFNSVLLSNSSYNSGANNHSIVNSSNSRRQQNHSSSLASSRDSGSGSRSDSYRVAMNGRTSSYRNAMHQSKSFPNLPPSRQSGPFRVAMDMSPNRAFSQNTDDDVMSRADSYRIAVRNTNPVMPVDIANRNTSYRVAVNDDVPSAVNAKLDALGLDDKKLMSGRDVRRMGITDVDQVKDINPKVVMRESKSVPNVQHRSRDSKPSPNAMGPSVSHVSGRNPAQKTQTQQTNGRIRKCTKQDVDPIQIVATVDTTSDAKKSGKNNPNRSSTYIQFDPIFEDTEDFTNAADIDMSSLDYSMNLSKTSKSKYGMINGSITDANANNVKLKKTRSSGTGNGRDAEIEDNWRFSQV
ncbi:NHS-like 1b [Mactra antiquata]